MASVMTVTVDTVDYVFTPESSTRDAVRFRVTGSTLALPRTVDVSRVLPARTKAFPGVARNIVNFHWNAEYGVDDPVVHPIVFKQQCSRRADTPDADFLLARKVFNALLSDSEMDAFYAQLIL